LPCGRGTRDDACEPGSTAEMYASLRLLHSVAAAVGFARPVLFEARSIGASLLHVKRRSLRKCNILRSFSQAKCFSLAISGQNLHVTIHLRSSRREIAVAGVVMCTGPVAQLSLNNGTDTDDTYDR
jgi:succinate dehydrogenase/fumarate reductase flavoprotein subunit